MDQPTNRPTLPSPGQCQQHCFKAVLCSQTAVKKNVYHVGDAKYTPTAEATDARIKWRKPH